MRVLAEETHQGMRISIFHMNQKYIVKMEKGPLELSYKLSDFDFSFADAQEAINFAKSQLSETSLNIFRQMMEVIEKNSC
ncbi:MAG: hypothetical protein RLZZ46_682 [Bacteroidota bacterium]|jgi:hypothetical protein